MRYRPLQDEDCTCQKLYREAMCERWYCCFRFLGGVSYGSDTNRSYIPLKNRCRIFLDGLLECQQCVDQLFVFDT